jgi:curli production assembly/transport component CsgG
LAFYFADLINRPIIRLCLTFLMVSQMSACTSVSGSNSDSPAVLTPASKITVDLHNLPSPKSKVTVAVYGLRDLTGQYKPSPDSSFSNSVTQGGASILVKALYDSGWYIPVEREDLQNLLTERKIVRAVESETEKGKPSIELPGLVPAILIIQGSLIGYDSNVRTGGAGANYLGIGGNNSYRVDQVTISLRMVDTRTGQVLGVTTVTKTIYSKMLSTGIFAFTSFKHLLQTELGFSTNEPGQMAVKQALEAAIIQLTLQGVRDRFLTLKDDNDIFLPLVQRYLRADPANLKEFAGDNKSSKALIGFHDLTTEGYTGAIIPLVASPGGTLVLPAKHVTATQKPAANTSPSNSNKTIAKPPQ